MHNITFILDPKVGCGVVVKYGSWRLSRLRTDGDLQLRSCSTDTVNIVSTVITSIKL